ncbi:MAG: DNA-binding protein, partial [Oceanospirillum sp.]|nr:DNA-binding protein [Oceanospirillum sp.]
MNQDANLQDICTQQIQRWLDEGQTLSAITAAELHQATGVPYTQCVEILHSYTPGGASASASQTPPPPAALQEVFRQSQQQIWQTIWQEHQHALEQLKQNFAHEKKQLQQTADERLSMIEKLEQNLSEKDTNISELQEKFHQQLSVAKDLEQANHDLSRLT